MRSTNWIRMQTRSPPTGLIKEDVSMQAGRVILYEDHDTDPLNAITQAKQLTVFSTRDLVAGESVTVVATGDIIVHGNLEADAGLISLISQCGDVRLVPNGIDLDDPSPPSCLDSTHDHDIRLINVAVLAPNGSMWMPDWETGICPYPAVPPTFTFEGSVSSGYVGLHGEADDQGEHISGWRKDFSYPNEFWLRRPLWWPEMSGGEWLSTESLPVSLPPQPGLMAVPSAVTITEGSTTARTLEVELNTQPSADVTVDVTQSPSTALPLTSTLTFTPDNWSTAQMVSVSASAYEDEDAVDTQVTVTMTATSADSAYGGLTADVVVTIRDDDTAGLVVSPSSVTVNEGDGTGTVDVSLATLPSELGDRDRRLR